jgi:ATP/maltotriose-dependent transcriptional regulator MalT
VALARGRADEAVERARAAMASLGSAMHEDQHLDVVLSAANAFVTTGAPDQAEMRPYLQRTLGMIAQRTRDEDARIRWLRGPVGRELTRLAGPMEAVPVGGDAQPEGSDTLLLRSLVQGKTNREIAEELGVDEQAVARRLGELFVRIGASSRAEATAFAFHERVL